jgi:hypothetical protein
MALAAMGSCWHTQAWADDAEGTQTVLLAASATQTTADPAAPRDPQTEPESEPLPAGTPIAVPTKTAWIKVLGWSADGSRLAFRAGAAATANRPGDPCTIVRLRPTGQVAATLVVQRDILQALIDRRIHSVRSAPSEAVSDKDVLLAPLDERLAAVVRDAPMELAVLRRDRTGRYQPVLRQPIAAGEALQAWAFGNPTGTLVAVVAEVRTDRGHSAYLFVIPTTTPTPPTSGAGQP